jgi:hypothetical protein
MARAGWQWPAFLIALVAGWFVAGTIPAAAIPAMPAVALEQSASCPAAEIIGVHGTSEGPSSTDPHDSPEIKATFGAFTADEQKLGQHGARLEYYPYPTLGFADYLPTEWQELAIAIDGYSDELEAELEGFSHACPGTPISLVGYSLGAMLINNMLSIHDTEWSFIDAFELYGDPCWHNPHGDYRGLAQCAAQVGFRLGCFPENSSLHPLASPVSPHFAVQSLCHGRDPVCGQDWPSYEVAGQVIAAALCGLDKCPHLSYTDVAASYGAEFPAADAFKQTGRGQLRRSHDEYVRRAQAVPDPARSDLAGRC